MILEIAMTAMVLCNNHNWTYSPRCNEPVKEMHITPTGDFYGTLEDGRFYSTIRESETTMNVYIDQQLIGSVINGKYEGI